MLTFNERIDNSITEAWDRIAAKYGSEKVVMFDLETTGLSSHNSFIYIIGINIFRDGGWHIMQLFNDDGRSEPEMLRVFMDLLEDKRVIFHFNGDTFDIPFVRGRLDKIRNMTGEIIPDRLKDLESVDLIKEIRPLKNALGLPNARQKTIEQFLGIKREDQYDGGQLIGVYLDHLSSGSSNSRRLVLLHNRDDMEGMFHLARMHAYTELCDGRFCIGDLSTVQRGNLLYLILPIKPEIRIPVEFFASKSGASLQGNSDELSLSLTLREGCFINKITREAEQGFYLPQFDYTGLQIYADPEDRKCTAVSASDSLLGDPEMICE